MRVGSLKNAIFSRSQGLYIPHIHLQVHNKYCNYAVLRWLFTDTEIMTLNDRE